MIQASSSGAGSTWSGGDPPHRLPWFRPNSFSQHRGPRAWQLCGGHLERWLILGGGEAESSGYDVLEWVKASASLRLLPKDIEAQVVARPELQTYAQRLSWIKPQLAHQRATSQAQAVAAGSADMALGEFSGAVDSNAPELARLEALAQLLQKGKGACRSNGGGGTTNQKPGGKGGPQGGGPGASGKPDSRADQARWHCGQPGHKR